MDVLRSCYTSTWRFPGGYEVPGRFYFNDGAEPYPHLHYFGSANWHRGDGTEWPAYGEIDQAARPWHNGSFAPPPPPAQPAIPPEDQLGGDDQVQGVVPAGPATWELVQGVPLPCYPPPLPTVDACGDEAIPIRVYALYSGTGPLAGLTIALWFQPTAPNPAWWRHGEPVGCGTLDGDLVCFAGQWFYGTTVNGSFFPADVVTPGLSLWDTVWNQPIPPEVSPCGGSYTVVIRTTP